MRTRAALWKVLGRRRFSMLRSSRVAEVKSGEEVKSKKAKGKMKNVFGRRTGSTFAFFLLPFAFLTGCGVRFDMQDQPRYKAYKKSEFFNDNRASRNLPEGTVARGFLKEDKALHTGKIANPNMNAQVE